MIIDVFECILMGNDNRLRKRLSLCDEYFFFVIWVILKNMNFDIFIDNKYEIKVFSYDIRKLLIRILFDYGFSFNYLFFNFWG